MERPKDRLATAGEGAKRSRLSLSLREDINRQMQGLRNQGLRLDERLKIHENRVDRSVQERR